MKIEHILIAIILLSVAYLVFNYFDQKLDKAVKKRNKGTFDIKMYNDKVEIPPHAKPIITRVVDILIYPVDVSEAKFEIYPVLRDQNTGDLYVSFDKHGYGKYFYHFHKNEKRIDVRSAQGRSLERNDNAKLYLAKSLGRIITNDNKIIIGAQVYKYGGQMNTGKKLQKIQNGKIYNITSRNFPVDINHSIYYDGYVEFEK